MNQRETLYQPEMPLSESPRTAARRLLPPENRKNANTAK